MVEHAFERQLHKYLARVEAAGLDAPWSRPGPLIEPKRTRVVSRLWRWTDIEPLLRQSAEFVAPGQGTERRILRLANPGVPERTATHTISIAVQYLLPGEIAPAHRHTPNALRFMLHGEGAYTTVEGEKCVMRPGDLVLTPSLMWHDHGNEGTEPVIWLDALDSPIVRYVEALLMQPYHQRQQVPESPAGRSEYRFGAVGLRPAGKASTDRFLHYRWEAAFAALERLSTLEAETSPFDDVLLEYVDPASGRSVFPTLSCFLQMIRPGVRTRAHRQTSSAVYYVVRGRGFTFIEDVRYDWQQGDFFVIAPWDAHAHGNEGTTPAVLFSVHDIPLLTALGLYREEPL
jgi:gentisate 1,2-dioxygenase